ncbi:hypothetical protein PP993_gp55 [Gordonia phage Mayweather]|uniref:Lipoprotein n=1 Tax=Gordonia phage Mayweather TaxID=2590931 RepID=A0A516KU68_9CAUD|nr:hypothetical protein PP993_gp55 [Gordonia phage Mayweather]QDP45216.1 hypothetical protein SEA_MAYWEATHER_55 [Gordonia phage Mayweather]
MNKKLIAILAGVVAACGMTAAPATAMISLDAKSNVRYMVCGDGVAEIEYNNAYGNYDWADVDLSQGCWFYDLYNGSDEFGYPDGAAWADVNVTDTNGGYVSCVVWVNGVIEGRASDNSEYYSYASCY